MNGHRLRAARQRAQLNQTQLGARVGLSQSMIGALERGEREASLANVRQLAAALDVSVPWLLADTSPDTPEALAADPNAPAGLRALAADAPLVAALVIQPAEWTALRSIQLPRPAGKDGYLALLLTVRLIGADESQASTET